MQHPIEQRGVRSRAQRKENICCTCNWCLTRISHNELTAAVSCLPEIAGHNGEALANVRTYHKDTVCMERIANRIGCTIKTERELIGTGCRGHAEATIVIGVARAESNAGKLTHQVALLVGHRGTTVGRNSVLAVLRLNGTEAVRNGLKHFVPTGTLQWTIFSIPS